MRNYTREEILNKCKEFSPIEQFYNASFVNYRGVTKDTKEEYTEVVAEYLVDNLSRLNGIREITREKSYKVDGHNAECNRDTIRVEEKIAMDLFNECKKGYSYDNIGRVIDYQIPLKNIRTDKAGKIDLLSIKKDTMYILELKIPKSVETMLRCVLESFTYLKTVNQEKLIQDFGVVGVKNVKAAPLVYYEGEQYKEMQQKRPNLMNLMGKLGIAGPFYYEMAEHYEMK